MNKMMMIALSTTLSLSANSGELIKDEAVAKPFVDACLNTIKSRLTDEDSMKAKDIRVLRENEIVSVVLSANSKNGFGGYTGYKLYVCKLNSNLEIVTFFNL